MRPSIASLSHGRPPSHLAVRLGRHTRAIAAAALAIAAVAVAPRSGLAQFPSEVQVGTRVRIWLPEEFTQAEGPMRRLLLRGTTESVTADTLRISIMGTSTPLAVPREAIRRLEVSGGWPSRAESAAERAMGGAAGGAILWALMNDPRRSGGPHYRTDWRAAGVGAAWGAGFGAVFGLLFPHEQWHHVRLRR